MTFTQRQAGGNVPINEAAYGPGDSVSVVTNADGRGGLFQNVPLAGGPATGFPSSIAARPYNGSVGLDGADPVVTYGTAVGDQVVPPLHRHGRHQPRGELVCAGRDRLRVLPAARGRPARPVPAGRRRGAAGCSCGASTARRSLRRWRSARATRARCTCTRTRPGDCTPSTRGWTRRATTRSTPLRRRRDLGTDDARAAPFTSPGTAGRGRADHAGVAVWQSGSQIAVSAVPLAVVAATTAADRRPHARTRCRNSRGPSSSRRRGAVRVRLKGSSRFVALTALDDVPFGATIDTRRGAVVLRARTRRGGQSRPCELFDGMFAISQSGNVVNFTLNEPLAKCPKRASAAAEEAEVTQAVGRRQGRVPDQRPLQRGDRPRHPLARPGHVQGHAHARDPGQRVRPRRARRR